MKKLLSLPPNLVRYFHDLEEVPPEEWFYTSDPEDSKLGSGGGTAWLLSACQKEYAPGSSFGAWLEREKRILLHAGGQSRRLPAYAPSGKVLTPIPVFRWERGQSLDQDLLSLQLPLYEKIMQKAPNPLHTLIASGDVYIRTEAVIDPLPEADVVCYGIWVEPSLATRHGVFVSTRKEPEQLDRMLQKPSLQELAQLTNTHLFLMDIGIWVLSDRAVELLMDRSTGPDGKIHYYDLYSDFGLALGNNPCIPDKKINRLSVAIVPLTDGEFYHFGTTRELITSTLAVQSLVRDQREIMHKRVKPHPAMFVQNAEVEIELTPSNHHLWVENSQLSRKWKLNSEHVITGVPANNWEIEIPKGICVDVVPIGEKEWALRPYGMDDPFRGNPLSQDTIYLGECFLRWMENRGIVPDDLGEYASDDIQSFKLFPVCDSVKEMGILLRWMISEPESKAEKKIWTEKERLSANELSQKANLNRLYESRRKFQRKNWDMLVRNYEKSVFYQLDLKDAAVHFNREGLAIPELLPKEASVMNRIHNRMFRAYTAKLAGKGYREEEEGAFSLLREGILETVAPDKVDPFLNVYPDQIVLGRSPVRIDLAGGWTDTPPYCLYAGGDVFNMAVELNGQPPLQVYIKPCTEYKVILRSIDLGATEVVHTYEELRNYTRMGSPFSIPKAALVLAGFSPDTSASVFGDLHRQLEAFGCGIEITLLAAVPAGSGLGTSSILAATVLGALNDFCGLNWDRNTVCNRTIALEQLLTTGGGWQDQYGGIMPGIKLLQTERGFSQTPQVRWLPETIFTQPGYRECHLLYYTGITRTAKGILAEIVASMFLNSSKHLTILKEMKEHTLRMYEAVQKGDFTGMGGMVGTSWELNKALDSGTNPPGVEAIIDMIRDYTLGYKLPGAGGGGYLYIIAKDPQAALRIREILDSDPPNVRARFVEMTLSEKGFQVSRS
ncbi:MAG: bifunctional fucokinase/L-fucose-1-P-guanylyltransferase [Bacteroides sp.]|nr:bifunctional fucokinase/L-fucose-1-P-guanylyltransferase [Bacteroides sp.]